MKMKNLKIKNQNCMEPTRAKARGSYGRNTQAATTYPHSKECGFMPRSIKIFSIILLLVAVYFSQSFASNKWTGIDETIVEKVAEEHGRKAMTPLINTDQGDLLLFVFLVAGSIGGFFAGYCWAKLTENKAQKTE